MKILPLVTLNVNVACAVVLQVQTHPLLQPGHLFFVESILFLQVSLLGTELLGLHEHTQNRANTITNALHAAVKFQSELQTEPRLLAISNY